MNVEKYQQQTILGLRVFQFLCIGFTVTGFVWSTADLLLTTVLVGAPVTPLSLLLLLYGCLGTLTTEGSIRIVKRKAKNS